MRSQKILQGAARGAASSLSIALSAAISLSLGTGCKTTTTVVGHEAPPIETCERPRCGGECCTDDERCVNQQCTPKDTPCETPEECGLDAECIVESNECYPVEGFQNANTVPLPANLIRSSSACGSRVLRTLFPNAATS